MLNRAFFLVIAFLFVLVLFSIGSLFFGTVINTIFLKINFKRFAIFVFIFNFVLLLLFFLTILIESTILIQIHRFLNYYLGFLLYAFLIGLSFWIIYRILSLFGKQYILNNRFVGIVFILIYLFINGVAIYNFEKGIKVEKITIESEKVDKNYKFVQIGDIQYGSMSQKHMEKVMKLAVDQNPDFILMVGDLIDFDFYKFEDFQYFESIPVPIYLINGNHEYYHKPEEIISYIKKIKSITFLKNEKQYFDSNIEIVGIDYDRSQDQLKNQLKNINLSDDKFSILLYHEPKGINYGIEKGFDLILIGHTHGGQIFPITKIVDFIYEFSDGFYQRGNTKIYTTDGAGLFGPKMRLGSQNEIVLFEIKSK